MPIVEPPRDRDGNPIKQFPVEFSARAGQLQGNNFEADGRHLSPNQPRSLIGATTYASGSSWRPAPGQTPYAYQHSLRHPGENNNGQRTELDGMTVWLLNNRPEDEPVIVLHNHGSSRPGVATPHPYPDEAVLIDGFTLSARDRFFRNHAPLVPRNSDGTFDFSNLLEVSSEMSHATYQPTGFTPNMKVIASDRNRVVAVAATDDEPGVEVRQFGLNVPGTDIVENEAITVSSTAPIGPQIYLRARNASHGPTDWTNDPDEVWNIVDGAEIEMDISRVWGPQADNVRQQTPIVIAVPASSGTLTSGEYFEIYGRHDNPPPANVAYSSPGNVSAGGTVALNGLSVPSNSVRATTTNYLHCAWSTNYVSTDYWRQGSTGTYDYPTLRFFDNSSGEAITRLLVHRAGIKINRDDEFTTWHAAYQWERRDGGYSFRGGHSGTTGEFPFSVLAGQNIRARGFGEPLTQETPTQLNYSLRKFPVDVSRAADEGSQFSAFYNVRYIPIRKTTATTKTITGTTNATPVVVTTSAAHGLVTGDLVQISGTGVTGVDTATDATHRITVASTTTFSIDGSTTPGGTASSGTVTIPAQWKTDTGYPLHDVRLDRIVVDNYLEEAQIAAGADSLPGGLQTIGGCSGCAHFANRMFFWGFPKHPFNAVTFTDGSKTVTSSTDTFRGWMNGRQLVFKGKSYAIRRVVREVPDAVNDAELELLLEYRDGTASTTTDEAYLSEDNNTLFFTIDDAIYGEAVPNIYFARLPEHGVITSVEPERNGAIVYCDSPAFRLYFDSPPGDVYAEEVSVPLFAWEKVNEDNSPAGLHSSALVEGQLVAHNGRGLSAGNTPENMTDITSARNARLFTELLDVGKSANTVVEYDQPKRHLLVSNTKGVAQTYDGEVEYGLSLNMQDGGELAILYPHLSRAAGTTRLSGVPRSERTAIRDGLIVMFVDVATVGTGGLVTTKYNSSTTPDPYIVIYDTIASTWQAIYVGDDSGVGLDYGIDRHANAGGLTAGTPPITSRHTIQLSDGSLVCLLGKDGGSPLNSRQRLKLSRSNAGTWSVTDYNSGQFSDTYFWSLLPNLTGGFYGLGKDPSNDGNGYMAVYEFGADSVEFPYKKGIGGRHHVLDNTAFTTANCIKSLAVGPCGEIFALGYTYTGGTGTIRIRRIDPKTFAQLGTDVTFTLPNGGDGAGGRTPRQFLVNRHNELLITHLNSSNNPALVRYKFADSGYAGGATTLTSGSANPNDKFGMMLDTRNVVWFANDKTISSLDGFNVQQFAESDSALTPGGDNFSRTSYDRALLSMVQAGAFGYYLVQDTPSGGGTSEWRLIKAIGSTSRTEGANTVYTGDGGPEADETIASTYTDLATQVAGSGGSISYVAIDSAIEDGGSCIDQANGTHLIAMRGVASL